MAAHEETVRITCESCGSRFTVPVSWFRSVAEFDCSCGAHLRADTDDVFQIRYHLNAPSEITLHLQHSGAG
jgi:hypothetical protein